MAEKGKDNLQTRLAEIDDEIEERLEELSKLQEELRGNPYDEGKRRQVQELKKPLAMLAEERGELARSISRIAGGKQYFPPVT